MRLMILEELYANEFLQDDRLLELIEGKYKICMFSKYSKNNRFQKSTLLDQQLADVDQKCISQVF
jgi:hypothetical protein